MNFYKSNLFLVKSLLLTALFALVFTACSHDDGNKGGSNPGVTPTAAQALRPVPRETVGNVSYYYLKEVNQIWVELPFSSAVQAIAVDGIEPNRYSVSVSVNPTTNLDRSEILILKQKYPGASLKGSNDFNRLISFNIDLGVDTDMSLSKDPSGNAAFFSGFTLLTSADGEKLIGLLKQGQFPKVSLQLKMPTPYIQSDGSVTYELEDRSPIVESTWVK